MWKQNIAPSQVVTSSYVLCWAAKWLGNKKVEFDSVNQSKRKPMLRRIHELLCQADAVVHYNGKKFDIPTLNKEFVLCDMDPPPKYEQIDLLLECRRNFRFESNRLDSVAQRLGLGKKAEHEGFQLWVKCMDGDKDAWGRMKKYNRQDVILLEKLYKKLLPWIKHPNHGLYKEVQCCTNCGSENLQHRGFSITAGGKYRRYQCQDCSKWLRGNKSVSPKGEKMVGLA